MHRDEHSEKKKKKKVWDSSALDLHMPETHFINTFIMLGTASTVTINNKHKWMTSIKMSLCRDMDFLDKGGKLPVTGNLITLENAPHIHTHRSSHLIWCSGLQWW